VIVKIKKKNKKKKKKDESVPIETFMANRNKKKIMTAGVRG